MPSHGVMSTLSVLGAEKAAFGNGWIGLFARTAAVEQCRAVGVTAAQTTRGAKLLDAGDPLPEIAFVELLAEQGLVYPLQFGQREFGSEELRGQRRPASLFGKFGAGGLDDLLMIERQLRKVRRVAPTGFGGIA